MKKESYINITCEKLGKSIRNDLFLPFAFLGYLFKSCLDSSMKMYESSRKKGLFILSWLRMNSLSTEDIRIETLKRKKKLQIFIPIFCVTKQVWKIHKWIPQILFSFHYYQYILKNISLYLVNNNILKQLVVIPGHRLNITCFIV